MVHSSLLLKLQLIFGQAGAVGHSENATFTPDQIMKMLRQTSANLYLRTPQADRAII